MLSCSSRSGPVGERRNPTQRPKDIDNITNEQFPMYREIGSQAAPQSHHRPREGPFELNDIFAIINAVPAIALLSYGFFHKGLVPGLCFGAGLGITVFGMAYMFVHDGLVHKRFPVGPIANVPYFRSVAAAHQLHHSDKFEGVPYGLFLGPKEIEEVGGLEELEKETSRRNKFSKNS
ncbi:beta-carotene hydroxylase 2, chloroplastic-like [Olea europaea var. sylvestris]|uniref:beta-carotene hydroxylase 2, chloroplastic-like n=1 Tax=Olea europaea var. sylvestris TaxID=158386 RepID=UPI000C1CD084|nr:beta-carotene hydroxylase 2, chloroplastic-like [Olea europaea var. sylvestris]